MSYTPGPWKVKPFLTPDKDDDPMMVYHVEAGDLQERFDNLETDENSEYDFTIVDAIHAENEANARLIAKSPQLLEALELAEQRLSIVATQLNKQDSALTHDLITISKVIAEAKGAS